jgi:mannose-6-phosphate isomerase-like protein (cupin superfamily)
METVMTQFQAFEFNDITKDTGTGGPYRELMRRSGFSMGVYRLTAGGVDRQHPHESDEVYFVQSGRATIRVAGIDHPVGPGSVVSVDRGAEHRFTDITEDMTILVMFAPPEIPD